MTTAPVNKIDNTSEDPENRPQLILNHTEFSSVTTDILRANESSNGSNGPQCLCMKFNRPVCMSRRAGMQGNDPT
mgnify:CR=1 FL=1